MAFDRPTTTGEVNDMSEWYHHRSTSARSGPPPDRPPASAPPPRPPRHRIVLVLIGALFTVALFTRPAMSAHSTPTHDYTFTDFVNQVDANKLKTATIDPNGHVKGQLANGDNYVSQIPTAIRDDQLITQLQDHKVQITGTSGGGVSILAVILNLLPLLLFVGYFIWLGRRTRSMAGGIMGVGRSKARVYDVDDRPATRFSDIAGYDGAKREVTEVVDFLKHPDKYTRAGAVGPRGVLMVGPPGTGKTLMARAVAGEAE